MSSSVWSSDETCGYRVASRLGAGTVDVTTYALPLHPVARHRVDPT